jgi:hypothetical protein
VFFIHTEASDPDVASLLTEMMGPQVMIVPSLAGRMQHFICKLDVANTSFAEAVYDCRK